MIRGLFLLAVSFAVQADGLGRLFFSPEERRQMEAAGPIPVNDEPTVDQFTLNGVVRGRSGRSTAWVNGHAYYESDSGALQVTPDPNESSRVWIAPPQGLALTPLSVGQSIDATGRTYSEVYQKDGRQAPASEP